MTNDFVYLVTKFEEEFPKWDWLIRSQNRQSGIKQFLCNLTPPQWAIAPLTRGITLQYPSHKAWATTPEAAFEEALRSLRVSTEMGVK